MPLRPRYTLAALATLAAAAVIVYVLSSGDGSQSFSFSPPTPETERLRTVPSPASHPDAGVAVAPEGPEKLAGRVIDVGKAGVGGVTVRVSPETGSGAVREVVTEDAGGFEVTGLAKGAYRVALEGPGVMPAEFRRVLVPGGAVTLAVARRVEVLGIVTDVGAPVAGATVELGGTGLAEPRQVVTDPDGRFLVEDLPEGTFTVSARLGARAGFVPEVSRFGAGPWDDLAVTLGPAAVVDGRVTDQATGEGLAGARVALLPEAAGHPARTALADATGAFVIEGVLPGTWTVDAAAPGYLPPAVPAVEVAESAALRIDVALTRGGVVAGRVVDVSGVPVRGAIVELAGAGRGAGSITMAGRARRLARAAGAGSGAVAGAPGAVAGASPRLLPIGELGVMPGPIPYPPPLGAAVARPGAVGPAPVAPAPDDPALRGFVTDDEGRFRVDAVPAGKYVVRAAHPEFAPGEAPALALKAGATREDLVITLRRGVAVEGRVTDAATGAPILGAEVRAHGRGADPDDEERVLAVAWADVDGRYRLDRLTGEVELTASAPGYGDVDATLRLRPEDDGRTIEQLFALGTAGASISGQVTDDLRRPIAGAEVKAAGKRDTGARAVTDADGRFVLRGLADGAYPLEVRHADYPPARAEGVRAGAEDVRVTMSFGGGIEARVRDAHTAGPIASFRVRATGPAGAKAGATFQDGAFELVPLQPGSWTLVVEAKGYAIRTVTIDVPAGRDAREITVRDTVIELRQGATIAGTVYDQHGEIVAGAAVECGAVRGTTDKHGRFRLAGVEPGDVPVRASHPTMGQGETVVPLRSGDELLTVEIRLAP